MREAAGPDFELMVDAHTWWRMGDRSYSKKPSERLAKQMAEYRIAWLEAHASRRSRRYVRLKALDLVPLASGEHEPNELRFSI